MAFLGQPRLNLSKPSRTAPTTPGSVAVGIVIPLFVSRIERCLAQMCPDAAADPMFQINAEIWSSDRNEPAGTTPLPLRDSRQAEWFWTANNSRYRRVIAGELASGVTVTGNPSMFELTLGDTRTLPESVLNEDWGPFPPPGAPASPVTRDELFLRVYLATVFSSWQVIQTIDSPIVTGQFYGP